MRWLTFIHRWLGVGLCLLFAAWFLSGMVMIYQPYPSLSETGRLAHQRSLRSDTSLLPLAQLLPEGAGGPYQATLINVLGDPYLWWRVPEQERVSVVHAGTGAAARFKGNHARAIAASYYPDKRVKEVDPEIEYDQWIVPNRYDPFRPFHRVVFADPQGTVVYVSSRNGTVMQETTRAQRIWNYVGSVVHWIYPTVIRKDWALWDRLVWWLALVGTVGAVTGLTLGVVRAWGPRGWSSFRGWLRWHHLAGLGAGVLVLGWIFSGWLSMDHGRLFSVPDPTAAQKAAFHGTSLSAVAFGLPGLAPVLAAGAVEIEIRVMAGRPYLLTRASTGDAQTWTLNQAHQWQPSPSGVPLSWIRAGIGAAWPGLPLDKLSPPGSDDSYAKLRELEMPASVLRAELDAADTIWVHVDRISGEIVSVMDASRRAYRWFFNALHSLDLPVLTARPALWEGIMLTLLAIGTFFSITGVVLGMQRLFRTRKSLKDV